MYQINKELKMELTQEDKKVLKACNSDPKEIDDLCSDTKMKEEKLKEIISRLEKSGLIYNYDESWSLTAKGIKNLK
jgi:predicted transcriptional regulator